MSTFIGESTGIAESSGTVGVGSITAVGSPKSVEGETSHTTTTALSEPGSAEAAREGTLTIAFSIPGHAGQGGASIMTAVSADGEALLALNIVTTSDTAEAAHEAGQADNGEAPPKPTAQAAAAQQSLGVAPGEADEAQAATQADLDDQTTAAHAAEADANTWDPRERALLDEYVQQQHAAAREQGAELLALSLEAGPDDMIIDLEAVDLSDAAEELAELGAGAAPRVDAPLLGGTEGALHAGEGFDSPEVVGGVVLVAGGVAARGLQNRRSRHIDELMSRFRDRSLLAACRMNRLPVQNSDLACR